MAGPESTGCGSISTYSLRCDVADGGPAGNRTLTCHEAVFAQALPAKTPFASKHSVFYTLSHR
jgi:hypothetical protein